MFLVRLSECGPRWWKQFDKRSSEQIQNSVHPKGICQVCCLPRGRETPKRICWECFQEMAQKAPEDPKAWKLNLIDTFWRESTCGPRLRSLVWMWSWVLIWTEWVYLGPSDETSQKQTDHIILLALKKICVFPVLLGCFVVQNGSIFGFGPYPLTFTWAPDEKNIWRGICVHFFVVFFASGLGTMV